MWLASGDVSFYALMIAWPEPFKAAGRRRFSCTSRSADRVLGLQSLCAHVCAHTVMMDEAIADERALLSGGRGVD